MLHSPGTTQSLTTSDKLDSANTNLGPCTVPQQGEQGLSAAWASLQVGFDNMCACWPASRLPEPQSSCIARHSAQAAALTCGLLGSLNVLKVNWRRSSLKGSFTISSPSSWLREVGGAGSGRPAISTTSAASVRQYRMTAGRDTAQHGIARTLAAGQQQAQKQRRQCQSTCMGSEWGQQECHDKDDMSKKRS